MIKICRRNSLYTFPYDDIMAADEYKNIKLCILVPCYNEEETIAHFYSRLKETIAKYNYSVLFVDDGSQDRTLNLLQELAMIDPRVSYLSLSRNFSQQNALKAGYDHIHDVDCVVSMDADLQHPPEYIDQLIEKWRSGYDVVNTIRENAHKIPFFRQFLAKCFYTVINYISKDKIIVNGSDYRLLDMKVVEVLRSIRESTIYLKELVPWLGFRQGAVHFVVNERWGGRSKYPLRKQLSLALIGITSFSINPLRISSLVGGLLSLFSFLYGFYAVYVYLFTERTVKGWTSIIASILFIAGLQFIMVGIIGEYLGKTFLETKKRPLYILKERGEDLPTKSLQTNNSNEQIFIHNLY